MNSSSYTATILLLLCGFAVASEVVEFKCSATKPATCQSLIGYVSTNESTYANITSLFQVSFSSILGANNLLADETPISKSVKAGSIVRIPIPCKCSQGIGRSDKIPVYTVKAGDGLDAIARYTFDQFVNYTEIVSANNISNPSVIDVGQKLWIPLPCNCDDVEGDEVVHLAYQVASGDSVSGIATEFGTTESTLLKLNGIADPKSLKAEQILDVPLKACQSSISTGSPDYGLRLPDASYAVTAGGCVHCSCSSPSYKLDCTVDHSSSGVTCNESTCFTGTSPNIGLGITSTIGCNSTTCAYAGYTNTSLSSYNILTNLTVDPDQSHCVSGSSWGTTRTSSDWMNFAIFLHMILIWVCFM